MQTKHSSFGADLLSVGEAASLLGISSDTLRRWDKAGRVSSRRTPTGHRRYERADIERLLTAETSEAAS